MFSKVLAGGGWPRESVIPHSRVPHFSRVLCARSGVFAATSVTPSPRLVPNPFLPPLPVVDPNQPILAIRVRSVTAPLPVVRLLHHTGGLAHASALIVWITQLRLPHSSRVSTSGRHGPRRFFAAILSPSCDLANTKFRLLHFIDQHRPRSCSASGDSCSRSIVPVRSPDRAPPDCGACRVVPPRSRRS